MTYQSSVGFPRARLNMVDNQNRVCPPRGHGSGVCNIVIPMRYMLIYLSAIGEYVFAQWNIHECLYQKPSCVESPQDFLVCFGAEHNH